MMKATRVGDVIGNSTRLRRIEIYEFFNYIDEDDEDDDDYNPFDRLRDFFRGLVRNRSIEHFALLDISFPWNPFERLSPFFEHNHNLRCIELVYIDLPEFFESFLTTISSIEKSQLERVVLNTNSLGSNEMARFIQALHEHFNLMDLEISDNVIDRQVFQELARLFSCPASKIYRLRLTDSATRSHPFINDDCITILSSSLIVSKSIKALEFNCSNNISRAGWHLFSGVLCSPICLLERLTIEEADLDDNVITVWGHSLLASKSLVYLKIGLGSNSRVTSAGWSGFSRCLRSPTSTLLELDVSCCRIVDAGAIEIADALANNSTLKKFTMLNNDRITAAGWVSFFNRLINSSCSLEELDLGHANINNQGAAKLVKLLASMTTLRVLCLSSNNITPNGWCAFARGLRTRSDGTRSQLKELRVSGNDNMNEEAINSFARMLKTNTSLTNLRIYNGPLHNMTLKAFISVLGYRSSIEKTYLSNHTLHTLTFSNSYGIPTMLARLLEINRNENKSAIACKKIIAYHFSSEKVDIQVFT